MPTATTCIYKNLEISVQEALRLKVQAKTNKQVAPNFTCIECHERVKPHQDGGHAPAHFEHFRRNANCSLSHVARPKLNENNPLKADYEMHDIKALEGYQVDQQVSFLKRNQSIVNECKKRDNYTCQACGFRLENSGKFIIDCHHTKPLASYGERLVSLSELVCLCPTCHRIAHTKEEPFTVVQIKEIRGINSN